MQVSRGQFGLWGPVSMRERRGGLIQVRSPEECFRVLCLIQVRFLICEKHRRILRWGPMV